MNEQDLISVIVPIYGVEEYLQQCVNSIINQTYKNLEIILVDDGSPDNCPEICDCFAKEDDRIKVIHKKNGGLSDARNAGIECAKGKYFAFVDSDDWIESTMIENLLCCCRKFGVKLASCARYITDGSSISAIAFRGSEKVYSAENALNEILSGATIDVAAWDKLYARELFDVIRFPVGENNEDIAVFYKIIDTAGKIAHCGTMEYYYRNRPGSITKLKYSVEARKVIEKDLDELETFIDEKYPNCKQSFNRYKAVNIYALLNKYIKCVGTKKSLEYDHLLKEFKSQKNVFFRDTQTSKKEKMIARMILLRLYNPYLVIKEKIKGYK